MDANVWPLSKGWLPRSFIKIEVDGLTDKLPYPKFGLQKSAGTSDDFIVEEVEREAVMLAGPYISKEHDSFVEVCSNQIRVNHSFVVMGVVYGPREAPREKRGRGSGASASSSKVTDELALKKAKKFFSEVGDDLSIKVIGAKASRLSGVTKVPR